MIVLVLLGTILYGGYSVIQKGRNEREKRARRRRWGCAVV